MNDRRLYPPEFERLKRAEQKFVAQNRTTKKDKVYALALGDPEKPIFFYVGVAFEPVARFAKHRGAIELGVDQKQAYVYCRGSALRDTLHLIVLDHDGEFSEEEWRKFLMELGHPLQNEVAGNDVKRKKNKPKKSIKVKPCASFQKLMDRGNL